MKFFAALCLFFATQTYAAALTASSDIVGQKVVISVQPLDKEERPLESVPLNRLCTLSVTLRDDGGQPIDVGLAKFSAEMPAHRHGMVTKAVVQKKSPGTFLIEGVKLHMAGSWQFKFKLTRNSVEHEVVVPVIVE